MLHYKSIILPSNLLFHKSKFLITSRKEDIIHPSVFPIPIQKIYDFFPCEADCAVSGEPSAILLNILCILYLMYIHILHLKHWGGRQYSIKKGA